MDRMDKNMELVDKFRDGLLEMLMTELKENEDIAEFDVYGAFSMACFTNAAVSLAAADADKDLMEKHALLFVGAFRRAKESRNDKTLIN